MRYPRTIKFKPSDFESDLTSVGALFNDLLSLGAAAMVEKQDWQVNRICPPFVDPQKAVNFLRERAGPRVLHLGMGDGTCNSYFKKAYYNHESISYANCIFIDPRDVIRPVVGALPLRAALSEATCMEVVDILRDEFLIPASMNDATRHDEAMLCNFSMKDFEIRAEMAGRRNDAQRLGVAVGRAGYDSLLKILSTRPTLLIPENLQYRRSVSRLGTSVGIGAPISDNARRALQQLRDDPDSFPKHVRSSVGHLATRELRDMCRAWEGIVLGDFRSMSRRIGEEQQFHLIEGCRADAFLHRRYAAFLTGVLRHLAEGGIYVSDGILSSYSYKFYFDEFKAKFMTEDMLKGHRVAVVVPEAGNAAHDLPPMFLAGLVVTRGTDKAELFKAALKEGYTAIPITSIQDLEALSAVRKQMAWTLFCTLVEEHNKNHPSRHLDLEKLDVVEVCNGLATVASHSDFLQHAQVLGGSQRSRNATVDALAHYIERARPAERVIRLSIHRSRGGPTVLEQAPTSGMQP